MTRKVTDGIARIKLGLADHISLGNLDARRDWGDARDYVEAMVADAAAGRGRRVRHRHGQNPLHQGAGGPPPARRPGWTDWEQYVKIDPRFLRPAEVDLLLADPSKAKKKLGWQPKHIHLSR